MIHRLGRLFLFMQLFSFLSGCGTMANLQGRKLAWNDEPEQVSPKPFGGLDRDIERISAGNVFFSLDFPFSLVGDVVSLPKVLIKPDWFREGIRNGEILEDQGWIQYRKIKPDVVLRQIPIGTPIEQAKLFMEKHGFASALEKNDSGTFMHCTFFRRLTCSFMPAGQVMMVNLYYRDGLVTGAEVKEEYGGI